MNRRAVLVACSSLLPLAGCTTLFEDDAIDKRGELDVVIDGEPHDLSADRYQAEHADDHSIDFHLHEHNDQWYMEGEEPVTFATGIDLLPHFEYETEADDHVVTIDDTVYDGSESTMSIDFLADDESVDPTSYEIQDGDALRLEIETDE
ncbi:hypothetical protein [Natronorubrum sediminis]|nr:hypothetical protein [Natronorubrum sediminis]